MRFKRVRELAGLLILAAIAGSPPALARGVKNCLVHSDWRTRADNGDLIQIKPAHAGPGVDFEFPNPELHPNVRYGPVERLALWVEFEITPGRWTISVPLKTDGNNDGFMLQLREERKGVISSQSLTNGQTHNIRIPYTGASPSTVVRLRVSADARGKSWGTLGPVTVCRVDQK